MNQAQFVARQIGMRIRAARRDRKMTLEELGKETNLSAAFLSRMERGEATASIANLLTVAACFNLPLRELFEDVSAAQAAKRYSISRRVQRRVTEPMTANGYSFHRLSDELADPKISAFLLEFPQGSSEDVVLLSHEGEEILYLLEGRVEFQIGGDRFVLEEGDSVHFDCQLPHMGRNIGATPARMLMVVTPSHDDDHPMSAASQG